ncbi:hypothetical protein LTR84_002078 [Exophiala bonariae]|uniref:Uncharacterized protein n=1 Tax=Exophiala bonariae TaxID=1690606 RepID=A0AAV9NCY1_9EURO|nr:hypothetical protein LTR84_002078 [Exophiala bonariae]
MDDGSMDDGSMDDGSMDDDSLDDDNSDDDLGSIHNITRRRLAELEAQGRSAAANGGDGKLGEELGSADDVGQRNWAYIQARYLDPDSEAYILYDDSPAGEDIQISAPRAI